MGGRPHQSTSLHQRETSLAATTRRRVVGNVDGATFPIRTRNRQTCDGAVRRLGSAQITSRRFNSLPPSRRVGTPVPDMKGDASPTVGIKGTCLELGVTGRGMLGPEANSPATIPLVGTATLARRSRHRSPGTTATSIRETEPLRSDCA